MRCKLSLAKPMKALLAAKKEKTKSLKKIYLNFLLLAAMRQRLRKELSNMSFLKMEKLCI